MRELAALETRRDLEISLFRAAWHAAIWIRAGAPEWREVLAMLRGESVPTPTPEELLAKALNNGAPVVVTPKGEDRD